MKMTGLFNLLRQMFLATPAGGYARFILAAKLLSGWYPKLLVSEYGKIWKNDERFFEYYRSFVGKVYNSADRKFFLRSMLSLVDHLPGDTAECGTYYGASSWLICEHFENTAKTHYMFDSFEGLSTPSNLDGAYWRGGALVSREDVVRERFSQHKVEILKGWIPDRFAEVADRTFCFVHIDVDLYQPTLDSLRFFYDRMVSGGIILCDDYGFITCPGAKRAFDEHMRDKPEKIIHVPTGQGFIVKM